MKFNLEIHNKKYEETGMPHLDDCFCRRYKDGEDMWPPRTREPVVENKKWVEPRDPSQSEQPWEADRGAPRQDGKEMENLFGE